MGITINIGIPAKQSLALLVREYAGYVWFVLVSICTDVTFVWLWLLYVDDICSCPGRIAFLSTPSIYFSLPEEVQARSFVFDVSNMLLYYCICYVYVHCRLIYIYEMFLHYYIWIDYYWYYYYLLLYGIVW